MLSYGSSEEDEAGSSRPDLEVRAGAGALAVLTGDDDAAGGGGGGEVGEVLGAPSYGGGGPHKRLERESSWPGETE